MKTSFQIKESADWLRKRFRSPFPRLGLVLGSGLGSLAEELEDSQMVEVKDIPNWPVPTVPGHKGRLVIGKMNGTEIIIQQGRVHYYEGYSIQDVVFPIRVFHTLDVKSLILTNAAGGINSAFNPGDLMVVTDHLNLMFTNPLIGRNEASFGPRFPDMSCPYDPDYVAFAKKSAKKIGLQLKTGILIAGTGPSYETVAEVNMMRKLGGDCVCMSTVPEVIAANHMGMRILTVSCITNMATGLSHNPLSHKEVELSADRMASVFIALLKEVVSLIGLDMKN